ncbi:hypothetical protein NL492_26385, partial [Klebsiella pneumoniae]|nr:hypothetical protein [Klebsiella pneumoniae]
GTYNSANEVFHCVHLEAPAQVPLDSNAVEIEQEISKITKKVDDVDINELETTAETQPTASVPGAPLATASGLTV